MAKSPQRSPKMPKTIGDLPAIAQSLDTMSNAFSAWLRNANRAQAEAIRFLSDRFNKDLEMMLELAGCRNRKDIFGLRANFASDLVADYIAEGTRVFALHSDDVQPQDHTAFQIAKPQLDATASI